ncbi:MAG: MmgE/PrpD family protein [Pseudomonadota bacterium]
MNGSVDSPLPNRGLAANSDSAESVLATYIADACDASVPDEVLVRARCHLIDTLAAILSGRFLPAGRFAYDFVAGAKAGNAATLLGSTDRSSIEYAAFANAMAAHADETDDSHLRGRFHPGCGIVPAALAVAESVDASCDALLKAIALGYDIGARSTMALGFSNPKTTAISTHAFGTLFGAAAASGALLGLSMKQAEALLSFTVQQASGLPYWNRDPDHVEKSFDFAGKSARNGVFAALLAKAGMTAPERPLTGSRGYLEAYAEKAQPATLTDDLGNRYEILHATIKKWSVGSPLQSMLDAIEKIFAEQAMTGDQIDAVEVRLPSDRIHVVDDRKMPAVCAQHLAALAILRGGVSFRDSHDGALMADPEILALRKKIRLVPDDDLAVARPERQSIVSIRMTDGQVARHHAKVVRGTPDDPIAPEEVAAKAEGILAPILPEGSRSLIDLCLERDFAISDLVAACRIDDAKAAGDG